MLSFFPRDVLDVILNLIESVSQGFPTYACIKSGIEVIKKIPCSTQLNMKFFLVINVKMPTVVDILTFMSRKNNIVGLTEPEIKLNCLIFLYL